MESLDTLRLLDFFSSTFSACRFIRSVATERKRHRMKIQLFLIILVHFAESAICREVTCKSCDAYQHFGGDARALIMCHNLLNIPNCCSRFFNSNNALGPVVQPQVIYKELPLSPWLPVIATVVLAVAILATTFLKVMLTQMRRK